METAGQNGAVAAAYEGGSLANACQSDSVATTDQSDPLATPATADPMASTDQDRRVARFGQGAPGSMNAGAGLREPAS
jgi:hypothetical protein